MTFAHSELSRHTSQLVDLVGTVVQQSGDATGFNAAQWVTEFLPVPSPALGGRPPRDLMDTTDGRAIVFGLVRQMHSGAFA